MLQFKHLFNIDALTHKYLSVYYVKNNLSKSPLSL